MCFAVTLLSERLVVTRRQLRTDSDYVTQLHVGPLDNYNIGIIS